MADLFNTVLVVALPASGKSEIRRYFSSLNEDQCQNEFHMGPTVQIDDFPYVHMMRRIAQELRKQGRDGIFFKTDELPMQDPRDWGTLMHLLNEDYRDLHEKTAIKTESAAEWLMDRLDAARKAADAPALLAGLPADVRKTVAEAIEPEAADLLKNKLAEYPETLENKTIIVEFARGGPEGSPMPIEPPFGYRYSFAQLSEEILENSVVLYIWVTPEESRRKNDARADPDDPGSILHHGVPIAVMLGDYGCDDIDWLLEQADQPDTVKVEAHGRVFNLPLARFDNRVDKTSFIREDVKDWKKEDVDAIHAGLSDACTRLAKAAGKA